MITRTRITRALLDALEENKRLRETIAQHAEELRRMNDRFEEQAKRFEAEIKQVLEEKDRVFKSLANANREIAELRRAGVF